MDCIIGAHLSAAAAVYASVGIDVIDIAFRDSLYGANRDASAASDAIVVNYVCHSSLEFSYKLFF